MGSAQVETTTTLLAMLDEASYQNGCRFNGAIMRKALKSLANQDVQVCAFERLVTVTYHTVKSRFVEEADGVTAEDFYVILLSQTFQKLLKIGCSKVRAKEKYFVICNLQ